MPDTPRRSRLLPAAVAAAVGLQGMAAWVVSPMIHEREELYNAAHAFLVLRGGPDLLLPLQYQPFCGGCTVDAALGALSFAAMGPSIAAWRLVPVAFFALATACGTWLACRVAGTWGGLAAALLFAFAPPAYQELALIGNGNHPEGGALLLAQLALAASALQPGPRLRSLVRVMLLAVLVGFGLYFLRSLVLGLGVLALTLLMLPGGTASRLPAFLLSLPAVALGALPIVAVRQDWGAWPVEPIYQPEEWVLSLRWSVRNLQSLLLPIQVEGLWGDVRWPSTAWLAWAAFTAWLALGGALALRVLQPVQGPEAARSHQVSALHAPTAALLLLTLGLFSALYVVFRLGVWMDGQTPPVPQQVRYMGVAWPLALVVAASGAGAWLGTTTRAGRFGAAAAFAVLLAPGVAGRARQVLEAVPGEPWRRLAPDWCFQEERIRGDLATLTQATAGTPLALPPFAAGLLSSNPGFALKADGHLPTGPFADPSDAHAWSRGRALGALMDIRDRAGAPDDVVPWLAEVARRLPPEEVPPDALREAAWCHARDRLWKLGHSDPGSIPVAGAEPAVHDVTRTLEALARGAVAARTCVVHSGTDARIRWDSTCPAFVEDLPPYDVGWGAGASLAETRAATLARVELAGPPGPSGAPILLEGFQRGWTHGTALSWIPPRLPALDVVLAPAQ